LADLGEMDMSDPQTLQDFATWAIATYPAEHYALIMSDHGMGWPGGWTDAATKGNGPDNLAITNGIGDGLWLMELDKALYDIQENTGLEAFELIGMDACLMAQLEVFTMLSNHARYAVASQEVEPALGWAYASFLVELVFAPEMNGGDLGKKIVETYIAQDERIKDDAAREVLVEEMGLRVSSAQKVAEKLSVDVTLTAVDLAEIPYLNEKLDEFVYAIAEDDPNIIAEARSYAQAYESAFDDTTPSPYIDLYNFTEMVAEYEITDAVTESIAALQDQIKKAVIAEKHGKKRDGSNGITIYFPVEDTYSTENNWEYSIIAGSFTDVSQWDEYLNYFYTNGAPEAIEWNDVRTYRVTTPIQDGVRPGAIPLEIDSLSLSSDVMGQDETITIDTVVHGSQIAYIYYFLGILSDDVNYLTVKDIDYLDAENTQNIGGVFFPNYEGESVEISYEFTPTIYAINTGTEIVPVLFNPEDYGEESATYVVSGIYHFTDGSDNLSAELVFRDGELISTRVYAGLDNSGPSHEIFPVEGDSFTVWHQVYDLQDGAEEEVFNEEGETLTFGAASWTWEEVLADSGYYVVGFMAEDFDGNTYEEFALLEIK